MTKVAIIPARAGSKRLPHKNRMTINNKSLVEIAVECAIESRIFDDIIVSTDDDYFFTLTDIYPEVTIIQRPNDLASDTATSVDVIKHVSVRCSYNDDTYFCLLQPTSPLRKAKDITDSFGSNVVSVYYDPDNIMDNQHHVVGHLDKLGILNKQLLENTKCQDLYFNGLIYWTTGEVLKEQNSLIGPETVFFETPLERSFDIDFRHEFDRVKHVIESTQ